MTIAFLAAVLRLYRLGQLSFWYDEVVTMLLARSPSPRDLIARLFEIDATRAPLHPILLTFWLRLFGTSEFAARSFSVLCGVLTIALIYQIGRDTFDKRIGLWAAWLAALSPILIVYSREARMYAWLVLVTCLCWRLLLALRSSFTIAKAIGYVLSLAALVYSHPLGLLMLAALTLAGLLDAKRTFGGAWQWMAVHVAVALLILPWIGYYFDHDPEFLSERLPLRFLLGTLIGFIGGKPIGFPGANWLLLLGLFGLIVLGIIRRARESIAEGRQIVPVFLLCWLILPPVALYVYSWLFHPVFGPPRYTAFVAPAYLILVASGMSRLPVWARFALAIGLAIVSSVSIAPLAYNPDLKADWRAFSADLALRRSHHPDIPIRVIVASADPTRNVEVETARYYLPAGCEAVAAGEGTAKLTDLSSPVEVYYAVGGPIPKITESPAMIGPFLLGTVTRYPGLTIYRFVRRSS